MFNGKYSLQERFLCIEKGYNHNRSWEIILIRNGAEDIPEPEEKIIKVSYDLKIFIIVIRLWSKFIHKLTSWSKFLRKTEKFK